MESSDGPLLTPDRSRLLDSLLDQAALAIERIQLADDIDRHASRQRPKSCVPRFSLPSATT